MSMKTTLFYGGSSNEDSYLRGTLLSPRETNLDNLGSADAACRLVSRKTFRSRKLVSLFITHAVLFLSYVRTRSDARKHNKLFNSFIMRQMFYISLLRNKKLTILLYGVFRKMSGTHLYYSESRLTMEITRRNF